MNTKVCNKCGTEKQISEFHKNRTKPDGLQCHCKECKRVAKAEWRSANPEKSKETDAMWYAANTEKVKVRSAAWYASNIERVRERNAANYIANIEKHKARDAAWAKANPEKRRIYDQNRRARKLAAIGRLSPGIEKKLFILQRGKCPCCNQSLGDDYHLDHIVPLALGGSNMDSNMQLLRSRCNLQKHIKHPIDFMKSRGMLL